MSNQPLFTSPEVKHLFATPLVITKLDQAQDFNDRLKQTIVTRSQQVASVKKSNSGGWQSATDFLDWSGDEGAHLIACARALATELTLQQEMMDYAPFDGDWKVNAWANINRSGNANNVHSHPGAFWSGTYYVHVDAEEMSGTDGQFEAIDPRGVTPIMYAPHLTMRIKGCVTAGHSEFHAPVPGQLILFPSWLPHAVRPYKGEGMRISVAFNFSI